MPPLPSDHPISADRAEEVWREDLTAVLLSATVVAGLFLDGWNHLNLQDGRLGSFFTPWHGLLYAGFTANAMWVISRNQHLWRADLRTNPAFHQVGRFHFRYPYALAGVVLVFTGMVGDLIWHTVLGEETDVARVIAPFHIILFLGASLLIAAPLRSAWYAPAVYPYHGGFVRLLPALLSIALLTASASFLFQWLSPFMEWTVTELDAVARIAPPPGQPGLQTTMAARVVLADILFVAPILLAMRRWSLPMGTATLSFGLVAFAMSALTSFDLVATCLGAVIGGVATDLAIRLTARNATSTRMFVVAVVAPLACWPAYFVLLRTVYDARWPVDFFLGASFLAALVGLVLAFLTGLPDAPEADEVAPASVT